MLADHERLLLLTESHVKVPRHFISGRIEGDLEYFRSAQLLEARGQLRFEVGGAGALVVLTGRIRS